MSFTMQAGSLNLKSPGAPVTNESDLRTFESVTFPTPFPMNAKVVVIPMVQTFNGADTPGVRITEVTPHGFKIRMNELIGKSSTGVTHQPLSDGNHTTETIGWIAISV